MRLEKVTKSESSDDEALQSSIRFLGTRWCGEVPQRVRPELAREASAYKHTSMSPS